MTKPESAASSALMPQGKVVVITGGADLLGRTFSRAELDGGGSCVIADVDDATSLETRYR